MLAVAAPIELSTGGHGGIFQSEYFVFAPLPRTRAAVPAPFELLTVTGAVHTLVYFSH